LVLGIGFSVCAQVAPTPLPVSSPGSASVSAAVANPTKTQTDSIKPSTPSPEPDSSAIAPHPRKFALKRLPTVAVLSFTGEGIDEKDLVTVTNRFENELLATDSFKIVERRDIDKILREQGFQESGACDNSECSVEVGKLLSAEGIYTGEVAHIGKTWTLSVKMTDVGSGQTVFSHVLDINGSLEDVLRGGCPEMALIASGRKKPENSHTVLVAQGGSVVPWVVGGVIVAGGATTAAILLLRGSPSSSNPTRNVSITW